MRPPKIAVMATWEDGPEYAPLERPDAFDAPSASTVSLTALPTAPGEPPAPLARPAFADPQQPVPQLANLVPAPPAQRNPSQPFDVVASVVTTDSSAWAAAHWSPPTTPQPPTPSPLPQQFPPQPGPIPQQFPAQQFPARQSPTPQFPAPGTPQWFGPAPSYQQPPVQPATPNARTVLAAATPGVVICLAIGGLIWVLAPVTVVLAFFLTGRIRYGRTPSRAAFGIALALLGSVGLLALVSADGLFSQWWDMVAGWACFASWALIVTVIVAAYRAVKQGRPDPLPPRRRTLR